MESLFLTLNCFEVFFGNIAHFSVEEFRIVCEYSIAAYVDFFSPDEIYLRNQKYDGLKTDQYDIY